MNIIYVKITLLKGKNMNITLAQLNPIAGDIEYNKNKIFEVLKNCKKDEFVIFPELFIYGYHNFDMVKKFPYIINQIKKAIDEIRKNFSNPILISFPDFENDKIVKKNIVLNNNVFNVEIVDDKQLKSENYIPKADTIIYLKSSISRCNSEYLRNLENIITGLN